MLSGFNYKDVTQGYKARNSIYEPWCCWKRNKGLPTESLAKGGSLWRRCLLFAAKGSA